MTNNLVSINLLNAEESSENISLYAIRKDLVKHITSTISLILIFIAFLIPWIQVRQSAKDSVLLLSEEQIKTHSSMFAASIETLLKRYETNSNMLAELSMKPEIVICDPAHFQSFINFGKSLNENISPRPYRYYTNNVDFAACQIEFDREDTSKFWLYYATSYNQTYDIVKKYSQDMKFEVDIENGFTAESIEAQGILDKFMFTNASLFAFGPVPYHVSTSWGIGLAVIGAQTDPRVMSPFFIKYEDNMTSDGLYLMHTMACVCLFVPDIYNEYMQKHEIENSRYVLIDNDNRIIIENSEGALDPIYEVEEDRAVINPVWPTFDDYNSSFWSAVWDSIKDEQVGVTRIIRVGDVDYMIIKQSIDTRSGSTYKTIIALSLAEKFEFLYSRTNNIIIVSLVIIGFVLTILLLCMKDVESRSEKKIAKRLGSANYKTSNFFGGSIADSIKNLRNLELKAPDKVAINNIIDKIINGITSNLNHFYGVRVTNPDCDFCKYLEFNPKEGAVVMMDQQTQFTLFKHNKSPKKSKRDGDSSKNQITNSFLFSTWIHLSVTNKSIAKPSFISKLTMDYICQNPKKTILEIFQHVIVTERLFFVEFDPDSIMLSISRFIQDRIKNPLLKAVELYVFCNILEKAKMRNLIPDEFDILTLFFSLLIKGTLRSKFNLNSENDSFSYLAKNFSVNDEKVKSISLLELNSLFDDDFSFKTTNDLEIKDIIDKYIIHKKVTSIDDINDNLFINMFSQLSVLLENKALFNMDTLSLFFIRLESPEYSPARNTEDRILLMKSLVSFIDFYPIFLDTDFFVFIEKHFECVIFTNEEIEDREFVRDFLINLIKTVVLPSALVFTSLFPQMNKLIQNINNNLDQLTDLFV